MLECQPELHVESVIAIDGIQISDKDAEYFASPPKPRRGILSTSIDGISLSPTRNSSLASRSAVISPKKNSIFSVNSPMRQSFDKSGHKKIVSPSQKSINKSISITSSPSKNSLSKNVSVDDVSHKSLEGFKSETQSSISQSFSSSPSSPAAELSALLLKARENEIPLQSPVPDSLNNSQYEASVSEMNSSTVSRSLLSSQSSKYLAPSSPAVLGNYESRSTPKNLNSPLYVSSNRSTLISPSVNNSSLSSLSKSLHRIESSATKVAASMRMNLSRSLLSSPNKSIHISQDGTNLESNEIMNDELINETNRSLESNSLMSGIITPKYKIMNNSYSSPIKTSLFIHSYIIM